eukprot:95266_1
MQRASIKRSFNCEDLSSIDDGLDSHLTRAMEAQESGHEENYYSRKRRKAMSLDSSSSWTTSIKSISIPPSVAASVSNDSITPKATSTLAAVSSSTTPSHVATATAITPDQEEVVSPSSSDEVGSLPYFPSLRRNRSVSCDFPATAALEQIMLKHRRSPTNVMGNDSSSHSLEEREVQWPRFQEEDEDTKDFLPSPRRNVENFAYTRRVSLSRPSSSTSSSSCTLLHNNPNSIKSRSPPTVNQITEALETLARI